MQTKLHTLQDIFDEHFPVAFVNNGKEEIKNIKIKKIVIPLIQRDYAQGRKSAEICRVRERFLEALYDAVTKTPITLDFIYGDIDSEGILTPLDGQQHLTTLFLLYWYAAKSCGVLENEYEFLKNFSYETRFSAREFCSRIIKLSPQFGDKISEEIVNLDWFPYDWLNDATISSMLVMIDAIQEKFSAVDDLWDKLSNGAVSFYFLPIKDMGLTDELYIKMNSRGKPLTNFEHFKAELEQSLRRVDNSLADRIAHKIDTDWTDLLWIYRDSNKLIDSAFLRYFRFICDIICYRMDDTPQGKNYSEFDLIEQYFSKDCPNVLDNIYTLESFFECWLVKDNGCTPKELHERFFDYNHAAGKVKYSDHDLLRSCCMHYGKVADNGNRYFPLHRTVFLYAFITYLLNRDKITEEQFTRRIRIINNLIMNSADEISDSKTRQGGNRLPAILKQVDSIILNGKILDSAVIGINFNVHQLSEEQLKIDWLEANPGFRESLYELEDNDYLNGQIAVVGLDNIDNFKKFIALMKCNRDLVDCALLTIGNYSQMEKSWGRYIFGTASRQDSWRKLFHKGSADGFDNTKRILGELLSRTDMPDNNFLQGVIDGYIQECNKKSLFDWRYYYINYAEFRPNRYGKYYWADLASNPYVFSALWTEVKESENAYQPLLKVFGEVSRQDLGKKLIFGDKYITLTNSEYLVFDMQTYKNIDKVSIVQNSDGIDVEDRIIKMRKYLQKNA